MKGEARYLNNRACDIMLTPKDVLYLEDVLDQTFVLCKRLEHEMELLETEEVIDCVQNTTEKLKQLFTDLLSILEEEAA